METKILLVVVVLIFSQCTFSGSKKRNEDSVETINWTKDGNGCLHIRNKALAIKLINKNRLMNNAKEKFLDIFKAPNKIEHSADADILEYYFNNTCINNKPVIGSDKCIAKFYFKSNKLIETDFVCE